MIDGTCGVVEREQMTEMERERERVRGWKRKGANPKRERYFCWSHCNSEGLKEYGRSRRCGPGIRFLCWWLCTEEASLLLLLKSTRWHWGEYAHWCSTVSHATCWIVKGNRTQQHIVKDKMTKRDRQHHSMSWDTIEEELRWSVLRHGLTHFLYFWDGNEACKYNWHLSICPQFNKSP